MLFTFLENTSLSAGAPAGIFMIVMAVLAFFKGVVKQLFSLLSAIVGFVVGCWIFKSTPNLLSQYNVSELTSTVLFSISAFGGFIVFSLFKIAGNWFGNIIGIFDRFARLFGAKKGAGMIGALFSFLPSSVIILLTGSVLRFGGTVEDMENTNQILRDDTGRTSIQQGLLSKIASKINSSPLGKFYEKTDPTLDSRVSKMVELILLNGNTNVSQQLFQRSDTAPILNHPLALDLIKKPGVIEAARSGDITRLLNHPSIKSVATSKIIGQQLDRLNLQETIDQVLTKEREQRQSKFRPQSPKSGARR